MQKTIARQSPKTVVYQKQEPLIYILHVDDDEDFLIISKQHLKKYGLFQIETASSVKEAKQKIAQKQYDAVIADYQMPDKTGLEFLKELRDDGNNVPFILFTKKCREEVAIEALNFGADRYFNKNENPDVVYMEIACSIQEVVKNIRTTKRLQESEERLRQLVENAPEAIYVNDLEGVFIDGNKQAEELTGYKREELIGKNMLEINLFPQDYLHVIRKGIEANKQGKKTGPNELELIKKDGSIVFIEASSIPVERNGKIEIIGITRNITAHKKAEIALRTSEERFRSTLDSMMEGCQIIDYNWRYLYINETAAKHGRMDKKDLLGKTMMEAYPGIEKTDLFSVLSKCMKERLPARTETEFKYPNGESALFELSIEPVPEGIFVLSVDMTDRRKAEEKIRDIAKFPSEDPNPVLRITKDGTLIYSNKAAQKYGCNEKNTFVSEKLKEAVVSSLDSGLTEEVEIECGSHLFSFVVAPIPEEGYANIYGRNITENREAWKSLEETVNALVLMNEKLGVVGRLTRHDGRNKLAVILNNIYLAKQRLTDDPAVSDYLTATELAVEQLENIFDFAKNYEMLGAEELSYLNVEKSINEAALLFSGLNDVTLVNECGGLTVLADSLLRQLFYNLIHNSLRYGEKLSQIRVYYKNMEDGQLGLIYEDDGVGIVKAEKEKIFKEGYGRGTGYGLYLIRKICEAYNWTISETGAPGKGAQFVMVIPKTRKDGKLSYLLDNK